MLNQFYVYFHICRKTQRIVYIGKGKGNRAYDKNRSEKWKRYMEENDGFDVEFYQKDLTECEALDIENKLINEHKVHGFLLNISGVDIIHQLPVRAPGFTKSQRLKMSIQARIEEINAKELAIQKAAEEEKLKLEKEKEKEQKRIEKELKKEQKEMYARLLREERKKQEAAQKKELNKLQTTSRPAWDSQYSTTHTKDQSNKKQMDYLYSQGKINSHHYFKQKSKW